MLINGDSFHIPLANNSVHCVMTSPPYWGLREYKHDKDQLGLEETPEYYVSNLVEIFEEVKRVLRDDGVLFLNLGDCFNGSGGAGGDYNPGGLKEGQPKYPGRNVANLKERDLVGVPWRVAFALQRRGWYLRSAIPWMKPSAMPQSIFGYRWEKHRIPVGDQEYEKLLLDESNRIGGTRQSSGLNKKGTRPNLTKECPGCAKCTPNEGYILKKAAWRPTLGHEYIFMLTKSDKYYCDSSSVLVPYSKPMNRWGGEVLTADGQSTWDEGTGQITYRDRSMRPNESGRNMRSTDIQDISMKETAAWLREMADMIERVSEEPGVICDEYGYPLVMKINPRAYMGDHFAAYPVDLVTPLIKAATSRHGCCATCGAQYAPVCEIDDHGITRTREDRQDLLSGTKADDYEAVFDQHKANYAGGHGGIIRRKYTGVYRSACKCLGSDIVPPIVFDPFVGTGTTLMAARALGLRSVGMDISYKYLSENARERLHIEELPLLQLLNKDNGDESDHESDTEV